MQSRIFTFAYAESAFAMLLFSFLPNIRCLLRIKKRRRSVRSGRHKSVLGDRSDQHISLLITSSGVEASDGF